MEKVSVIERANEFLAWVKNTGNDLSYEYKLIDVSATMNVSKGWSGKETRRILRKLKKNGRIEMPSRSNTFKVVSLTRISRKRKAKGEVVAKSSTTKIPRVKKEVHKLTYPPPVADGQFLRNAVVTRFETNPNLAKILQDILSRTNNEILWECNAYGEGFGGESIVPIVANVRRKALRLWRRVIKDRSGRDSFEEEVYDNLRYALYTALYWESLKEQFGYIEDQTSSP